MAPVSNGFLEKSPRRTQVRREPAAPWAHSRPRVPLSSCTSAELDSNGVDLMSGMALATGAGPSIHWKTPAASAVPLTHHRLSPRHSSLTPFLPALSVERLRFVATNKQHCIGHWSQGCLKTSRARFSRMSQKTARTTARKPLSIERKITAALVQAVAKHSKPSGLKGRRGSGDDEQPFTERCFPSARASQTVPVARQDRHLPSLRDLPTLREPVPRTDVQGYPCHRFAIETPLKSPRNVPRSRSATPSSSAVAERR